MRYVQIRKSRQLFDPNDASVIAYGELVAKEAVSGEEANGYKKFSIDIKYRKTDVTPSYIVVVDRKYLQLSFFIYHVLIENARNQIIV